MRSSKEGVQAIELLPEERHRLSERLDQLARKISRHHVRRRELEEVERLRTHVGEQGILHESDIPLLLNLFALYEDR